VKHRDRFLELQKSLQHQVRLAGESFDSLTSKTWNIMIIYPENEYICQEINEFIQYFYH
jgi:hypothetical protein